MKNIIINKSKKKIKININKYILNINGPLGTIELKLNNFSNLINNSYFLKDNNFNLFLKTIKTLFQSVTNGWFIELYLNGLGYKSFKLENKIALDLGYSNIILYKPTSQVKIKNFKNKIVLFSINKEYLHNLVAYLRNFSFPDAYKGKGIIFKNEDLKLKKKTKS